MRSENFLLVAITAERFACRPSSLVGLRDPVLALDFDLAAAARLLERDRAVWGDRVGEPSGLPREREALPYKAPAREECW